MAWRGVADPNILISAAINSRGIPRQLWVAALDGRWQVLVSPHLLAELEDVLRREKFRRWASIEDVETYLADLRALVSTVPDAPEPWPAVTGDVKDDYLVALAKSAGVDALVSGDPHLTKLVDLVPPVIRPADFLALVMGGR